MDLKDKNEEKNTEEIVVTESEKEEKKEEKKFEKYCYMCRRSEKQAGKLLRRSGDIHICQD